MVKPFQATVFNKQDLELNWVGLAHFSEVIFPVCELFACVSHNDSLLLMVSLASIENLSHLFKGCKLNLKNNDPNISQLYQHKATNHPESMKKDSPKRSFAFNGFRPCS